ncbi:proton pump-interactor 1-like [Quillaja saponaria]|uniref:Proton pump-interactor 1-like n=1 Tax=Quillaja saponaria TaxID=32244 RepID=A0AAD7VN44_QUISA|nr:proton pump-interactor 1-like [Quillaja saponaria]
MDELQLDDHKLNFSMLHGSRSLAEEKQLLRQRSMSQQRHVASFVSVEVLGYIIKSNYYQKKCEKLLMEVKKFKLANENGAVKCKNRNSKGLKEAIRDQIKVICDEFMDIRKKQLALKTKVRHTEKEVEAINRDVCSLKKQLEPKHQRKNEAYQCILKLRKQ